MAARLVDTHCHVQADAFDEDREAVIARALEQLDWLVVIGDDLKSSQEAVALSRDRIYATVGVHPHHAASAVQDGEPLWAAIRELAGHPSVVALGEIGLDYFYDFSPHPEQQAIFARQLGMAIEIGLPVVVHSRESDADTIGLIEPLHRQLSGGIMHCFGGGAAFAEQCLAWGFYVSFAGNVTFPKATALREAAQVVPMDRLLVETDSPYLAPKPVRGKRCEPAYVQHTAAFLAELKGLSLDEFTQATTRNAEKAFRLRTAD